MAKNVNDVSQRTAAIAAGISIVLMAVVAGFSFGFVLDSLVVSGDAAATAANILASETLFRVGVFGWIVILILDVIVAWALYVVLKRANKSLSLLTAWFRLVYAALLGVSLLSFVIVLLLISGADYLKVFEADQLQALVLLFINAFDGMWRIGLVVFGCHLLLLGYLVYQSGYIPKVIGFLLIIASLGYLIDNLGTLLLPDYTDYTEMINLVFMLPMIVGEVGLGLWLLIKGGKDADPEAVRGTA